MARILEGDQVAMTYAGTCEYMAPEMLARSRAGYDKSIDWWAVGILLYEMLTGATPFFNENRNVLNRNIVKSSVKWSTRVAYTAEFKDLVEKLLIKNPA